MARRARSPLLHSAWEAKLRLVLQLAVFFAALLVPITLLIDRVYDQLSQESLYLFRTQADEAARRINMEAQEVLGRENSRPFEDYSYYRVQSDPLLPNAELQLSPLAGLPPQTSVAGIIGFFQIDPHGRFSTPVLPVVNVAEIQAASPMQLANVAARQQVKERVEAILYRSALQTNTSEPKESLEQALSANTNARENAVDLRSERFGRLSSLISREKVGKSFASRQEIIQLAEPELVQQKFASNSTSWKSDEQSRQVKQPAVAQGDRSQAVQSRRGAGSMTAAAADRDLITTFQGSVDPLQLATLPSGEFVFYRRVWRENQRFIQGFLVNSETLLRSLIGKTFYGTPVSEVSEMFVEIGRRPVVRFELEEKGVSKYRSLEYAPAWTVPKDRGQYTFTAPLEFPLDAVALRFEARRVPVPAGRVVVTLLAVALFAVMLAGTYGIYRVGARQIDIAKERSDFVSAVSHELRTPLTSIRMYSEMLRSGFVADPGKLKEYYDFIFSESERLSRLISNVLQLSRFANHSSKLELEALKVSEAFQLIRSKVESQVQAAGFRAVFFEPTLENSDLKILADEDALVQMFINLTENALKFSANAEPKEVQYVVRHLPAQLHSIGLCVRDFGPGIEPDKMKKIFQPFYRAEDALTRKTSGTGIGLALVKELAGQLDGVADVANRNPGAEFSIWFREEKRGI